MAASCITYQGLLPTYVRENATKIHVKSAQRSIFRHKIKTGDFGEARVYNGFTKKLRSQRKLLPENYDFSKIMEIVLDSFSKKKANPNSRFRFDLHYKTEHCFSFCADKRAPNPSFIKKLHSAIGIYQEYRFESFIFSSSAAPSAPWHLSFAGFIDTRNKDKYFSDIHRPDGILTNGHSTVNLKRASLRDVKRSFSWRTIPILEMTGYKFILDGKILGFINLADQDIWIKKDVDEHLKIILVSAAISILIRNQIS